MTCLFHCGRYVGLVLHAIYDTIKYSIYGLVVFVIILTVFCGGPASVAVGIWMITSGESDKIGLGSFIVIVGAVITFMIYYKLFKNVLCWLCPTEFTDGFFGVKSNTQPTTVQPSTPTAHTATTPSGEGDV